MIAPVFAANWKMNNGPTTAREFMLSFCSQYPKQNDRTVVFFPPALSFHSVAQVLGDVRQLLRPDVTARQVALELAVSADLPTVHGDRVQIQQVLLNLIINAMDALEGLVDRPPRRCAGSRPAAG